MALIVKCTKCNGTGKHELARIAHKYHKALKKAGSVTVAQYAEATGLELTNAHHRMKALVSLGAAKRVNTTSPAVYRAV
jgi:hypothetical protein